MSIGTCFNICSTSKMKDKITYAALRKCQTSLNNNLLQLSIIN